MSSRRLVACLVAGPPEHAVSRKTLREWGASLLWLNLFLSPLLVSARTTEAFEFPKITFQRAVAVLFLAGGMAAIGPATGARTRVAAWLRSVAADPIALGVVLSFVAGAVSAVFSISPRTSLLGAQGSFAGLAMLAAQCTIFFAARALCSDPASARVALSGAAAGMGVAAIYGVVQFGDLDPLHWEAPVVFSGVARVFSTQGHPNSFAQLLAVSLPVAVYLIVRAIQERRANEAVVLGAVVTAASGLSLLTLSRAGVLATGSAWIALAVGGALVLAGRKRWLAMSCLGGMLALGVVVASVSDESGRGLGAMAQRLAGLGDGRTIGDDPRRFLWAAAANIFLEHPLVGAGLDCFSLAFGRHRTPAGWVAEWGETPLKAHSQPLEILATEGLLGALAALMFVYGVARALPRAWKKPGGDPLLALAAFSGLLAFGVHTLFHFPTAAGSGLALTLAAVLSGLAEPRREEPATERPIPFANTLVAAVLAAALLFVGVLQPFRADVLSRHATTLLASAPRLALDDARHSVRLDPSRDLPWLRLAAAGQAAARAEKDPVLRKDLFAEARRAAAEAVRLEPLNPYGQANLGTVLADLERESPPLAARAEVEEAFERARSLDPNNSFVHVAAATAALAAGDRDRAISWARLCSRLYPRFATPRALWGAASLLAGRELAAAGHVEPARMALEQALGSLREALAAEWHGDDAAKEAAIANRNAALRALAELD